MRPKGFLFSVARAGIKKSGAVDMCLIYSETDAAAAATFTTNKVKAAPVWLGMKRIRAGRARAVVVNSGNANSCTGWPGMRDAEETARVAAGALGVSEKLIFPCSTGVIGVRLPLDKMRPTIKEMAASLGSAKLKEAAQAIMTTDAYPKYSTRKVKLGSKEGVIAGIAKGAGMIAPNMATMLCFLMTDIAVEPKALRLALREAVEHSFNRITVDGDRSTNDTALVMANGALGNTPISANSRRYPAFRKALSEVTYELSRMIASDGEGATKLVEVEVRGARSDEDAKRGAFKVANSILVKSALHGADPNWGRILVALGTSGIEVKQEKTDVFIGGVKVVLRGVSTGSEREARRKLKKKEVNITVDLHLGQGRASVLTCDLTEEYVRFNSEYTT
ncbi:MAG: bifunctional glutamate N-acetyltransferase/amino-acid acetyltransferase ArgJ [Nitrospirota bacterium]|jgi:glutamate N-acetyltransferase/amino-acid N-acetyltransferase